jgi:S1-C subfamily serine protease
MNILHYSNISKFKKAGLLLALFGSFSSLLFCTSSIGNPKVIPVKDRSSCYDAKTYTIKLVNGVISGSGVIIKNDKSNFYILTTAHLLTDNKVTYHIYTSDGKKHSASVVTRFDKVNKDNAIPNDLAILKFKSKEKYRVAKLMSDPHTFLDSPVFAAGYPIKDDLNGEVSDPGFVCNRDGERISVVLSESMKEGYQIGYCINIVRGMSGGPLFDSKGKVIGINAKRSYPLTAKNRRLYKYQDGSEVDAPLDLLFSSSWAVPIQSLFDLLQGIQEKDRKNNVNTLLSDLSSTSKNVDIDRNLYPKNNTMIPCEMSSKIDIELEKF